MFTILLFGLPPLSPCMHSYSYIEQNWPRTSQGTNYTDIRQGPDSGHMELSIQNLVWLVDWASLSIPCRACAWVFPQTMLQNFICGYDATTERRIWDFVYKKKKWRRAELSKMGKWRGFASLGLWQYYGLDVCVPAKFTCWNPTHKCDGIRRWGFWR